MHSKKQAYVPIPHQEIYRSYIDEYELLRSRMDYEGNLLNKILKIVDIRNKNIVEMAAGTGKLTGLLAPIARQISAFDISAEMIGFAKAKFDALGASNVNFKVADNRNIPMPNACADIVAEGWSLGYLAFAAGDKWKEEIGQVIQEMKRLSKPGGTLLIMATLGTGVHDPKPPNAILAALYDFLELEVGFSVTPWFKTDYLFDSVEEAVRLTTFFWSHRLGDFVSKNQLMLVPECSAIWYKKLT